MIGIIDYGMGNILSVKNALDFLGENMKICSSVADFDDIERFILPGVGAFGDCIANLHRRSFVDLLHEQIIVQKKPILGICLGMQVMAEKSYEGGVHNGLGWFSAEVKRLTPIDSLLRIPHVGWDNVDYGRDNFLFKGLPPSPDLYFVHSYAMCCSNQKEVIATCDYGGIFTASVKKDNIVATQFHPEKSQDYGLMILENFCKWDGK